MENYAFLKVKWLYMLTFVRQKQQMRRQNETNNPFYQDAWGWQRLHLCQHITI